MAVTTVTPDTIHVACDGTVFSDLPMAEKWDKLISTKGRYHQARREYSEAVLNVLQTADGYPLGEDMYDDYYYVVNNFDGPCIESLSFRFYKDSISIEIEDHTEPPEFVVILHYVKTKKDGIKDMRIPTNKLYAKKINAEKEYVKLYKVWLARLQDHLSTIEQRIGC